MELDLKHPELHKHFIDGGFVASQSKRYGSNLPFDQVLEKSYNKPAKASYGIISMTRRKKKCGKMGVKQTR